MMKQITERECSLLRAKLLRCLQARGRQYRITARLMTRNERSFANMGDDSACYTIAVDKAKDVPRGPGWRDFGEWLRKIDVGICEFCGGFAASIDTISVRVTSRCLSLDTVLYIGLK